MLVCDVLSESQVESFFCSPADSKLFKVVYTRGIDRKAKQRLVEESELICKAVCLPLTTGHGFVIFPLHHEVERNG